MRLLRGHLWPVSNQTTLWQPVINKAAEFSETPGYQPASRSKSVNDHSNSLERSISFFLTTRDGA